MMLKNTLHFAHVLVFAVFCVAIKSGLCATEHPKFAEPIPNVTAAVGREAILQCTIDHLDTYKVAWVKVDTQTLLSYHTHVISRDKRLKVTNSNDRQWSLHIKELNVTDRGFYMCQLNTEPMINQLGFLDVTVPPSISDQETSTDTVVDDKSRVSLRCKASGYPTPTISWRREDGKDINVGPLGNQNTAVQRVEGEFLNLTQVFREDMAAYLCIASNGIPTSVSKRIVLRVNFQPKIRVSSQMVFAPLGGEATLACRLEASPPPLTSWIRGDGGILITNKKYELHETADSYRIHMQLKIKDLTEKDYGHYKCVAKNTYGEKEGFVRLIEATVPTSVPHSTPQYNIFVPIHKGETEHQAAKNDTLLQKKTFGLPATNSLRDESHHLSSEKQMSPVNSEVVVGSDELPRKLNHKPTQRTKTIPSESSSLPVISSLQLLLLSVVLFYHNHPAL